MKPNRPTLRELNAVLSRSAPGLLLAAMLGLAACASQAPSERTAAAAPVATAGPAAAAPGSAAAPAAPAPPPPPPAPLPAMAFEDAVRLAANNLLTNAQLPADGKFEVVIDPLIDGMTGNETAATRLVGQRIVKLIKDGHPRYDVQPFSVANVEKAPLLLVGTFTGVNADRKMEGKRETYRICLALADLKTGKLVGKGLAFATPEGVDSTPTLFYRDSPAWFEDGAMMGYIRTCQGTKAGDAINPNYVGRVITSARLADASEAYAAGKYANALKLYEQALTSPGGEQLRTYTGLYLTNWKLGKRDAAARAFGKIIDQGLETKFIGVKFLFRPGTAAFWSDPKAGPPAQPVWLREIATHAAQRKTCMNVVGHTSATGSESLNEKLSLQRAEAVRGQVAKLAPVIDKNLSASGMGSRQTLTGTGRDDLSDALDRRVEFKVVNC